MLRPPALLKGDMFLLALDETWFFRMHPREHPKDNRTGFIYAGDSKGGQASPFESSRKRGSRGRNPIERVSPPVRAFGYFSHERKVPRGLGPKAPLNEIK